VRITATSLDDEQNSVVLGDSDNGDAISGFWPRANPEVDIVFYLQGGAPDVIDQYNNSYSFTLHIYREHDDYNAATLFKLAHVKSVPVAAKLTFEYGPNVNVAPQCKIVPGCEWHIGAGTIFSYTVTANDFLTDQESQISNAQAI